MRLTLATVLFLAACSDPPRATEIIDAGPPQVAARAIDAAPPAVDAKPEAPYNCMSTIVGGDIFIDRCFDSMDICEATQKVYSTPRSVVLRECRPSQHAVCISIRYEVDQIVKDLCTDSFEACRRQEKRIKERGGEDETLVTGCTRR